MKKQYIIPITECIHIEVTHLVADSIRKEKDGITDTAAYDFLGREGNSSNRDNNNLWESEW